MESSGSHYSNVVKSSHSAGSHYSHLSCTINLISRPDIRTSYLVPRYLVPYDVTSEGPIVRQNFGKTVPFALRLPLSNRSE